MGEFEFRDRRRLRAGPHVQPAVLHPGDRTVRLEVGVLDAGREVRALVDHVGLGETGCDVADLAVQFEQDVAHLVVGERVVVAVQLGRAVGHRLLGIEDRGQHLVLHHDPAAALFGGADRVGDHGHHPLAREPHDVVEDVGVVGIHQVVGVDRGAVALPRDVLPRVDAVHAGNRERGGLVDRDDAGVGVRRMQHLEVQHALHLGVHGELDRPGHHAGAPRARRRWCRRPRPGVASSIAADAVDRVLDGAISGAAAQVSLQRARQVLLLLVGEGRRRHDHPRGAEAALEAGSVEELLLHRMQVLRCAEALDGGDFASLGAECGRDAAVHRVAVQPDRAGAAIACVATLLDAVPAQRAHERAQALAGLGLLRRRSCR